MVKIVVFDSGLGSLSIIKPIQKTIKSEIIYFADQKNFPYGKKSKNQLKKIIQNSIKIMEELFDPDLIVMGSNTPSLLFNKIIENKILGVLPPLKHASKISQTKKIAILATKTTISSNELTQFIKKNHISSKVKIFKINASPLIELVESGEFHSNPNHCKRLIRKILKQTFNQNNIDVVTLSSTHLPFLLKFLKKEFPDVTFLDPGASVAETISKKIRKKSKRNKLTIFTSGEVKPFQYKLKKIGITNQVNPLFKF